MIRRGDSPAGTVRAANGPVLVEGCGTFDGWCAFTNGLVNIVQTSITGHGAFICKARVGIVRAEVLADVVLDQGVGGPAVD